ncbi:MAG: CPBP family intramembrane metalloprotease, partial [Moorea sp. SIO2B7]|nr:CPBP family intramembrane metalloprotease [Moorena sp. SIO2B7]
CELVRGGFAYFLDKINGKPNTYINPDLGEFIYQYSDDLPFVFALIFFYIGFRLIHQRDFITLISPDSRFSWSLFFKGFAWVLILVIIESIYLIFGSSDYQFSLNQNFIILALGSLFLVSLQTSVEEIVFRGYLLQGLNLIFKIPIIAVLITSILFSLAHSLGSESYLEYGPTFLISALILGIFLADITLITDRLELAMGIHAANNLYDTLISSKNIPENISLFLYNERNPYLVLLATFLAVILFLLIFYRYQISRLSILFKKLS